MKSAISIQEHRDPLHSVQPGQQKATTKKLIEVPYTETVQVPVHTKIHSKGHEEKTVVGVELVPIQKFKEVKETTVEYKEEKIKGVKEVWVKKEVPYEKIVRKPVEVTRTKRVPYTDFEERKVPVKVKVPCDRVDVKTGYREDKFMKTKLMEIEQDLHLHHGPIVVREGTPRMREVGEGKTKTKVAHGDAIFSDGHRLRTGPDGRDTPPDAVSVGSARPGSVKEWQVNVTKPPGEAFGMKFDCSDGETIGVTKVKPGHFMSSWNDNHPDFEIRRGDRIVEVNGVRGNAKRLMDEATKSTGPVSLKVQGPRPRTPMLDHSSSLPQLRGSY